MMIVWGIRGKIIRTVLYYIVQHNNCVQSYAHRYQQFLQVNCHILGSGFVLCFTMVSLFVLGLVFVFCVFLL